MCDVAPFYFDPEKLLSLARQKREQYQSAKPFPHIVLDQFISEEVLQEALREFPSIEELAHWKIASDENTQYRKFHLPDTSEMKFHVRHLVEQFNSSTFCLFLEELTGIEGIIPDPHLLGGGIHQIARGGLLKVHADFNVHHRFRLDRRLNVLLYLNPDWKEEYGGHLELWDEEMSRWVQKILPTFARCVIFNTTSSSYHGHPDPLDCPDSMTRKSLAFYYYTNGRPESERQPKHAVLFQQRPNERDLRPLALAKRAVKQVMPPIAVDAFRFLERKFFRA